MTDGLEEPDGRRSGTTGSKRQVITVFRRCESQPSCSSCLLLLVAMAEGAVPPPSDRALAALVAAVEHGSAPRKRKAGDVLLRQNDTAPSSRLPVWLQRDCRPPPGGNGSLGRAGHCLVAHNDDIFLFGGCSKLSLANQPQVYPYANDHASLALSHDNAIACYSCNTHAWKLITPVQINLPQPRPRRHASMAFHANSLYVYGGFGTDNQVLADFWEFRLSSRSWHEVFPVQPAIANAGRNVPPPGRAEHSAVVHGSQMIIFGGYDGKRKLNDTYVYNFDTRTWLKPLATEYEPPARRCKHSAVVYRNKMYILGGFQFCNGRNFALTDLHVLNLETFCWSLLLSSGLIPEALQGHKAAVCGDSMYVVGGKVRASHNHSNPAATLPQNSAHPHAAPNGQQSLQPPSYDVTDPQPAIVTSVRSCASSLNPLVYQFRFETSQWSAVHTTGREISPRQLHGAVSMQTADDKWSIYIFGGADKSKERFYSDLVELRGINSGNTRKSQKRCEHCRDMKGLVNNSNLSDVVFLVEEQRIYAHKVMLVSRSEYFKSMFQSGMKEQGDSEVPISGVTSEVFLIVLEYLYCGHVDITADGSKALAVLQVADMFGLDGLRAHCVDIAAASVTVENAAEVCRVADQHAEEDLKSYCISFIVSNFLEVIKTDGFHEMMRGDPSGLCQEILISHHKYQSAGSAHGGPD